MRTVSATEVSAWMASLYANDLAACKRLAQRMIENAEADARAWHLLGLSCMLSGDAGLGVSQLRHAVRLGPDDASVWDALGVALQRSGEWAASADAFATSITLAPRAAGIWSNAAVNALECGDAEEAVRRATRATELKPDLVEGHLVRGNALNTIGSAETAVAAFETALRLRPGFAEAFLGLGCALQLCGKLQEAIAVTHRAAGHPATRTKACINLSAMYCAIGDNARAAEQARQVIAIEPNSAQAWSNMLYAMAHDEQLSPEQLFDAHAAFGRQFDVPLEDVRHENSPDPARKLRVGFVSADFKDHPVARFIEPILADFDRARATLSAYMAAPDEDAVSARLRAHVDAWHNVCGMDDARLRRLIVSHGIDILVDLSGHTAGNRLTCFALKPAPIQATWIGYPGTTGLAAMDYLICDRFAAPFGLFERFFTERFARLPSAGAFQPVADAPAVAGLPATRNGYLTFASFNRPNKLGDAVIATWARVLHASAGSRMLLGNVGDPELAARLTACFAMHGISADRLVFQPRLPFKDYLALHADVDVVLDTWPYSGGTTTNHALWMGVPVLAMRGPSRAHCQSSAVLERVGLGDWVVDDVDTFVDRALALTGDVGTLAVLRAGLRERYASAPLRRQEVVVRGLECAFRMMWQRWCEGQGPESFEVPADMIAEGMPRD